MIHNMIEKQLTTPKEYIQEYIEVLKAEIEELKTSKENNIHLKNGILQGNKGGRNIYQFEIDHALSPLNNVIYKLVVGSTKTECEFISTDGSQILLASSRPVPLGPDVKLFIDRTALPEKLLQSFQETLKDADQRYANAVRLFGGQFQQNNQDTPDLSEYARLNDYQKAAVIRSVQGDTIIWGPPGTGKTHTIAVAINEQIKQGHRVLLLSHANTAVDGAMEELADLLQDTPVYEDGHLVRVGAFQMEQYPLLSLDGIVKAKSEELDNQLQELEVQLLPLQKSLMKLQEIASMQEIRLQQQSELSIKNIKFDEQEKQINHYMAVEAAQYAKYLSSLEAKLLQLETRTFQFGRTKERIAAQKQQIEEYKTFALQQKSAIEQLRMQQSELQVTISSLTQNVQQCSREVKCALEQARLTESDLEKEIKSTSSKVDDLEQKMKDIEHCKGALRKQVIEEAAVIGTTLSMTFMSNELQAQQYDSLFIDEISMAPLLPMFFAMGLIRMNYVLIGDFLQLPPIGTPSQNELLQKWTNNSFFSLVDVDTVAKAQSREYIKPLSVQYRMNPAIAEVSNELFYGGILRSGENTKSEIISDPWVQETPLILVDTSAEEPWMNRGPNGKSRCNLYHGALAAALACKYLESKTRVGKEITIGIVVPYRPQKDLINDILDESLGKGSPARKQIEVNTVHSFQGGEKDVIICDSVESEGFTSSWFFFDDDNEQNPNARMMLNVAITRAKCKFIMLANVEYIEKNFRGKCFKRLIDILGKRGSTFIASNFGFGFQTQNEAREFQCLSEGVSVEELGQYNQNSFWAKVIPDLENARMRVIVFCPFVREGRIDFLLPIFQNIIKSGCEVVVYTRSMSEHFKDYQRIALKLIDSLRSKGITVRIRRNMHEKVILIDDKLVWQGSLNLLSHKISTEQMQRISSEKVQKEVVKMIDLNNYKKVPVCIDPTRRCEYCGGLLIQKSGAYGYFYGCNEFPDCGFTKKI